MRHALTRLATLIGHATRASIVLAATAMLLAIAYQVLMRYVFGATPPWSEELALLLFSWTVLGGLALGVHEGWHVRLSLLPEAMPARLRDLLERVTELATAAFGVFLAWAGLRFLDVTEGSVSAAIEYPIELLNGMAPVAGALIALFAAERALRPGSPGPREDLAA